MDIHSYSKAHLEGVVQLCRDEGWPTFLEDPERAHRVLSAPGVTTVVALDDDAVVGFAQLQSDGEVQAHLSLLAVARDRRRQGIARQLIAEGLAKAGGVRLDLITDTAQEFYASLPHKMMTGYRLYPS